MGGGANLPVGPGIWGFIAFFVLAIALWLLVRNMNTRLRRMAYTDRDRAQVAERTAEQAARERTAGGAAAPDLTRDATGDGPMLGTQDEVSDRGGDGAEDGSDR